MPAGLVKQYSQALGLRRSTCSAYPRMAGMLRRPIAKPPGPGRLLPEDAVTQRDPLVEDATLFPADPDGRHDVVGAVEGLRRHRSRFGVLTAVPGLPGLVLEQAPRTARAARRSMSISHSSSSTILSRATERRGGEERRANTDTDEDELHTGGQLSPWRARVSHRVNSTGTGVPETSGPRSLVVRSRLGPRVGRERQPERHPVRNLSWRRSV